jgi:hypothetical protein
MKQKLFISYSRRQTPFVDRFADYFEDSGYPLWLDYQRLIPARPWLEQIEAGVAESDVVLLIVSKDSLASPNVEPEWRWALKLKKRIILVIFEATLLPLELQACEWVDFRSWYGKSLQRLKMLIDAPQAGVKSAAPQSGFKASIPFWLALFLSVIVAIGSIPAWWTILVPYILAPLPWGIYKRNYVFSRVIPMLLLLPIFTTFSATFFAEGGLLNAFQPLYKFLLYPTFFASWLLLLLLLTPAIQRRVLPQAARVQFANPLMVGMQTPRPMSFAIDHAPEDARYADDLAGGLEKFGHRRAPGGEHAEASFVLISTYKTQTTYDPDHQAVYPIILQATDGISTALQRIQWIDFRNGAKHIDKLARLLPEPQRLLKALAMAPTGMQEVFPLAVTALQYFFLFTGMIGLGGLLTSAVSFATLILRGDLGADQVPRLMLAAVNGVLLIGTILYSLRGLRSRRHGTAAIYPLGIMAIFQGMIYFTNVALIAYSDGTDQMLVNLLTSAAIGSILTFLVFPLAFLIALPFLLFRWNELSRWFPRRQGPPVDRLENLFLLYSPSNLRMLIFQFFFHISVLLLYFLVALTFHIADISQVLAYVIPMSLIALFLRWLAVRNTKALPKQDISK